MSMATALKTPVTARRRLRHRLGRVARDAERVLRRRRAALRQAAATLHPPARRVRRLLARSGLLRAVHFRLRRFVLERRLEEVPVDRLLMGVVSGLSGREYAMRSGDLLWASRRVIDGPHADLLCRYRQEGDAVLADDRLCETPYVRNALGVVRTTGEYFGATTTAEILDVARAFVRAPGAREGRPKRGETPPKEPIRLRRIRDSDCFQVVDGHHRIATAAAAGATHVLAAVEPWGVSTPLQDLVSQLSWTAGRHELYQPIDAPELARDWKLVRQCTDRRDLVLRAIAERQDADAVAWSYLDVGACYGWFVAEMAKRGFVARGIELDPTAVDLGRLVYGLAEGQLADGECATFLSSSRDAFDVVSCFSVLHHFALGNGSCSAEELLSQLDRVTRRVLFLDTGEAHEAWFHDLLPDWTPAFIGAWLRANSTFREVVPVGIDADAVPPFENNYGRTLFACWR